MNKNSYHPTKDKLNKLDRLCKEIDCSGQILPCKDCEINKEYKKLTGLGLEDLNGEDIYDRI